MNLGGAVWWLRWSFSRPLQVSSSHALRLRTGRPTRLSESQKPTWGRAAPLEGRPCAAGRPGRGKRRNRKRGVSIPISPRRAGSVKTAYGSRPALAVAAGAGRRSAPWPAAAQEHSLGPTGSASMVPGHRRLAECPMLSDGTSATADLQPRRLPPFRSESSQSDGSSAICCFRIVRHVVAGIVVTCVALDSTASRAAAGRSGDADQTTARPPAIRSCLASPLAGQALGSDRGQTPKPRGLTPV